MTLTKKEKKLIKILAKSKLTLTSFICACNTEEITRKELKDIDFMEERIDTWSSLGF